ncbi:alpha-galactosidase A [Xylaria bambusicola]|uniref:alpha-galactosidase A n=1 Tax=Xylaria bambusicola TaxID=326684 RepID=UPI002008192B|nr:alpha-galactosidase A [Xylaria bambusicola]KAI0518104.1 alpha-galactosidase A [Xylaria bambusicola]
MYRIRSGQHVYYLTISTDITFIWHEKQIGVLSLLRMKRLRYGVFETLYEGRVAIAKTACFEWQIPSLTGETWAYYVLIETQRPSDNPLIAPEFLGHLTENGRVMCFLVENWKADLRGLGLVHGDVNRYNFIVEECCRGCVRLERLAHTELESLPAELAEETGHGSTITRLVIQP